MVAHLQKLIVLLLAILTCSWIAWWWRDSIFVAFGGAIAIWFCHAPVLIVEFLTSYRVNQGDPLGHASLAQSARACWFETWRALQVFCWQQPFRSNALADYLPGRPRRGVVLVHGFLCNRGFWNDWMRELRIDDRAYVAVNLEPMLGSIDDYIEIVEAAIAKVGSDTGLPPMVIAHSMGGLAVRRWALPPNSARLHRWVSLGTPHAGTWLARFSSTSNGRQMSIRGAWLRNLHLLERAGSNVPCTTWYSLCDNIVFPTSTATLPDADIRCAGALGHVQMAFDAKLRRETLALLCS